MLYSQNPLSRSPTLNPSAQPSHSPTFQPSSSPSSSPSLNPSFSPSALPTTSTPTTHTPTTEPTITPKISQIPTSSPSSFPTPEPSISLSPTSQPSESPTFSPSISQMPTSSPTDRPTSSPTVSMSPTMEPSYSPTSSPTDAPTSIPSLAPSEAPSYTPILSPTIVPTLTPSYIPTSQPSVAPSTAAPSYLPTNMPSVSFTPSYTPSTASPLISHHSTFLIQQYLMNISTAAFELPSSQLAFKDAIIQSLIPITDVQVDITSPIIPTTRRALNTVQTETDSHITTSIGQHAYMHMHTMSNIPYVSIQYIITYSYQGDSTINTILYNNLTDLLSSKVLSGIFTSLLHTAAVTYNATALLLAYSNIIPVYGASSAVTSSLVSYTSNSASITSSPLLVSGIIIAVIISCLLITLAVYILVKRTRYRNKKVSWDILSCTAVVVPSQVIAPHVMSIPSEHSDKSISG